MACASEARNRCRTANECPGSSSSGRVVVVVVVVAVAVAAAVVVVEVVVVEVKVVVVVVVARVVAVIVIVVVVAVVAVAVVVIVSSTKLIRYLKFDRVVTCGAKTKAFCEHITMKNAFNSWSDAFRTAKKNTG